MKTLMQFSRLMGMFILFMVMGCSSDDDTNGAESLPEYDYYVRYEVDGEEEEFLWDYDTRVFISGAINSVEEGGNFFMANSSSLVNGISINFSTENPIVAGETYSQDDFVYLLATYMKEGEYYSNGYSAMNSDFSSTDLEVLFSEISTTEARGQFSGTFEGMDEEVVAITNGEFFIMLGTNEVPEQ